MFEHFLGRVPGGVHGDEGVNGVVWVVGEKHSERSVGDNIMGEMGENGGKWGKWGKIGKILFVGVHLSGC